MKPKVYRKKKPSKGSNVADFKNNEAGGPVQGVIIGPLTSVGTVATSPTTATGAKGNY